MTYGASACPRRSRLYLGGNDGLRGGAGLRFGNLRVSGRNVVQISVAVPLVRESGADGLPLVLGNNVTF